MKSLHFALASDGTCVAHDLMLPMPQVSGIIDPEPFRARARGEGPTLAERFAPSGGMRSLHCEPRRPLPLFSMAGTLLTFIISGSLEIATANHGRVRLKPGDLFLNRCGGALDPFFTVDGDCRLIQLSVDEGWPGARARPVLTGGGTARVDAVLNLKRLFKGTDEQSHFREFDSLFVPPGRWSEITPLVGVRFIGMAEDTFIDWHPEIVNNLVIVLSGTLELEAGGGGGAVELFGGGSICLAEDRTGQGHIDRMHGHVQVAILIVDDADVWP